MVRVAFFVVILAFTALFTQTKSKEESKICYDGLGCFPMGEPWSSLLRPLPPPQSPSEIDTHIYCYTSEDPDKRYTVDLWPSINVDGLTFNAKRPTVFITHGFASSANETWMEDMKNAYLLTVDANVCKVDWGEGADTINYLQVAANTRVVGAELARFIRYLQSQYGLNASEIHLIGHSLGAHISAYAAKNVTGIGRITGLDVAQPGFEGYNKTTRLNKDDATFVDAIHTNGAAFFPNRGLGSVYPLGHVDFYMNGGRVQPGCSLVSIVSQALSLLSGLSDLANTAATALVDWSGCNHGRSFEYFTASLRQNCSIWGLASTMKTFKLLGNTNINITTDECTASTCVPLGFYTPEFPGRGVFTANTPRADPFCGTVEDTNVIVKHIMSTADGLSSELVDVIKGFLR